MSYKEEITKAMKLLSRDKKVLFVGQSVIYSGPIDIAESLEDIPEEKKIELPIIEDTQLGLCIGLSLEGYVPVCIYPRMDFLIIAMNQLVNHLDKIEVMSLQRFKPKVIIRTVVGAINPLNPGPQHCQDHTAMLEACLTNVDVIKLEKAEDIVPSYKKALKSERSTILIELAEEIRR